MNDILNMQPGPELDALVNEKLFGYIVRSHGGVRKEGMDIENYRIYFAPSTFLPNAWEVVEKWAIVDIQHVEWFEGNKSAHVKISVPNGDEFDVFEATGRTVPHAICLAALLALEGNRGD